MAEFFTKAKYSTISQDTDQSPTPVPQEAPLPPPQHPGALSELVPRRDIPEGLWEKCKQCDETIFTREREQNWNICPKCGYHYPLPAPRRIQLLTDEGSFKEIDPDMTAIDTLKFEGVASYTEKLASNQKKTGMKDAVICGEATLNGIPYALGVMDFRFLGASMGAVVGEKITRLFEYATAKKLPLIIVTASGGARMYEGMISLMQMAKTSGAAERHKEAGLPYLVIMTHPTTAGVTASFASLGDLIIAEPEALIGFAGPRVIRDTTQAQLPEGFQTAEFLLKKGLIDRIVDRKKMREEVGLLLEYFVSRCKVIKNGKKAVKAE
ncbi:MAG: acetyl-CoA carboxylase carboxyltransferase subunit beta [Lentisphaerae bacterium]|nr:acetyl-CoA carboxylase carboxyltransferase subunit beta [Lentisphaerota bacterium]